MLPYLAKSASFASSEMDSNGDGGTATEGSVDTHWTRSAGGSLRDALCGAGGGIAADCGSPDGCTSAAVEGCLYVVNGGGGCSSSETASCVGFFEGGGGSEPSAGRLRRPSVRRPQSDTQTSPPGRDLTVARVGCTLPQSLQMMGFLSSPVI